MKKSSLGQKLVKLAGGMKQVKQDGVGVGVGVVLVLAVIDDVEVGGKASHKLFCPI